MAEPAENADGSSKLTRRNLRRFDEEARREAAHRRGESTPDTEPNHHSLFTSQLSENTPMRNARLRREQGLLKSKPKTKEEEAALAAWWRQQTSPHLIEAAEKARKGPPQFPWSGKRLYTYRDADGQIKSKVVDPDGKSLYGEDGKPLPVPGAARDGGALDTKEPVKGVREAYLEANGRPPMKPPRQAWIEPERRAGSKTGTHQDRFSVSSSATDSPETSRQPDPQFPPDFPPYRLTQNMNEIAAYLANASYVASLGGPPLAELKYGIIIVPIGEESLLLGPKPDNAEDKKLREAVSEANRCPANGLRARVPNESRQAVARPGFGETSSLSGQGFRNVEEPPKQVGEEEARGLPSTKAEASSRQLGATGDVGEAGSAQAPPAVSNASEPETPVGRRTRSGRTPGAKEAGKTNPQDVKKTGRAPRKRGPSGEMSGRGGAKKARRGRR